MKKFYFAIMALMMSLSALAAPFADGEQYIKLDKPVAEAPKVVEFFSFHCPHCYDYEMVFHVSSEIQKSLPAGVKITKYHVDFLGELSNELTQAWAVAIALGVEDKIEAPLFEAVQKTKSINNAADIRNVFVKAGITPSDYDGALNSFVVKMLVVQQQKAAADFSVKGVPSFYVNGKYMVNNKGFTSKTQEDFLKEYSSVTSFLLTK